MQPSASEASARKLERRESLGECSRVRAKRARGNLRGEKNKAPARKPYVFASAELRPIDKQPIRNAIHLFRG